MKRLQFNDFKENDARGVFYLDTQVKALPMKVVTYWRKQNFNEKEEEKS